MRIYMAGKIGAPKEGQSEEEWKSHYMQKFAYAEGIINSIYNQSTCNPTTLPHDHDHSWESYMRECLIFMLQCDAVYALPDWADSKGATIEVNLAKSIGMPVYFSVTDIPSNPIPLCNDTTF